MDLNLGLQIDEHVLLAKTIKIPLAKDVRFATELEPFCVPISIKKLPMLDGHQLCAGQFISHSSTWLCALCFVWG